MKKYFCYILFLFLISQTCSNAESLSVTESKVSPMNVEISNRTLLSCIVSHSGGAENIRVVAASVSIGNISASYPVLYDDGTNGDIQAEDGIYSIEITAPGSVGKASIVFIAVDNENTEVESEPVVLTVTSKL